MKTQRNRFKLTKRELEILVKMSEGHTQKEIASQLYLSFNTINTHKQHIFKKMDVHSGAHAVATALRAQIIE